MCGNGREKKCIAEQSEGIAKIGLASRSTEGQRHSIERLSHGRQRHSQEAKGKAMAEDLGERAEQWGKKKSATWTACTACIRTASTSGR